MAKSAFAGNKWFADNLSWLLDQRGLSNVRVANNLGVSRQAVQRWRRGNGYPTDDNLQALCVTLRCTGDDLLAERPASEPMIPLAAWARRERIPLTRAQDLFTLRLLTGEQRTGSAILVPTALRKPRNSKRKVLIAKRRPRWVPAFQKNFPRLMRAAKIKPAEIGIEAGVKSTAVMHWAHRRNYPKRDRLPIIARVLGVTLQELAGLSDGDSPAVSQS